MIAAACIHQAIALHQPLKASPGRPFLICLHGPAYHAVTAKAFKQHAHLSACQSGYGLI